MYKKTAVIPLFACVAFSLALQTHALDAQNFSTKKLAYGVFTAGGCVSALSTKFLLDVFTSGTRSENKMAYTILLPKLAFELAAVGIGINGIYQQNRLEKLTQEKTASHNGALAAHATR